MTRELDPETRAVLERLESINAPPVRELSVEGARERLREQFAAAEAEPVARTNDYTLDGPGGDLPVRAYWPQGSDDREGPPPSLVWFHGGGFVLGDLETADPTCRAVANAAGCLVVSVDYRLAPEHPFPAGLEDCYAATEWVARNARRLGARPETAAVGGTSAGANLATAVSLMARDRTEAATTADGPDVAYQWLIYPATNARESYPSYEENARGYFLERADSEWFREQYFASDVDRFHPYAYPMEARDLSGLPPATVVTAEFDPLRDDGLRYADRLAEAGVDVTRRHYEGTIHGFFSMLELDRAGEAIEAVSDDFRDAV